MIERIFLGWQRPLISLAVEWLLERQAELPGLLVVVPTAQSGRRLRESLAEAAGALLTPEVTTPGAFLKTHDDAAAPDWMEHVAWVEVLETVADWSEYEALFPEPPSTGTGWAGGLAQEMIQLRKSLQENGLLITTAARQLASSVEAERWEALGKLEGHVERLLTAWAVKSRSKLLASGLSLPGNASHIVLIGVPELPPLIERSLLSWHGQVTALIGAPESQSGDFSTLGQPEILWASRPLAWPNGSVEVVADPGQQAAHALKILRETQTPSDEVALGSADTEVGDALARTLTQAGWTAFHPAAAIPTGGLIRWFRVWSKWLAEPTLAKMADLLSLPETGTLIGGNRAGKALRLAELRDRWMARNTEDLRRCMAERRFRNDAERTSAQEVLAAAESLEMARTTLLGANFAAAMQRLLDSLRTTSPATDETASLLSEWLDEAEPCMKRVRRGPGFWIERMLSSIPTAPPQPPSGRVIDVQGWLELFHEPGRHLILCGMNEGKVPARSGGEPWLSEAGRERLGLITDASRAARDAYLFHAMVEARRGKGGRTDALCGKSSLSGQSMLPSRLLLAAEKQELPARVKLLFKDVEPPEASMTWQRDFQWKPPAAAPPTRLSATSLSDYLHCPTRYYFKHVLHMQSTDPGRGEWDARDFGNIAHEVLERWGLDTEARALATAEHLHRWLSAELDRVLTERFGKHPPLAIRIQTESLRQRFLWLAHVQAESQQDGWDVLDVERKIELPVAGSLIVAKIDRIDRHRHTGQLRVLDYKTGAVDSISSAHRTKITASTKIPPHIHDECPAIHPVDEKGKSKNFLWHNLQLPLYAAALAPDFPTPCYFTLGATQEKVALRAWSDFHPTDLEAATACAEWAVHQIAAAVFWPPSEKLKYDDFAPLTAGRNFSEMIDPENLISPAPSVSRNRPPPRSGHAHS